MLRQHIIIEDRPHVQDGGYLSTRPWFFSSLTVQSISISVQRKCMMRWEDILQRVVSFQVLGNNMSANHLNKTKKKPITVCPLQWPKWEKTFSSAQATSDCVGLSDGLNVPLQLAKKLHIPLECVKLLQPATIIHNPINQLALHNYQELLLTIVYQYHKSHFSSHKWIYQ